MVINLWGYFPLKSRGVSKGWGGRHETKIKHLFDKCKTTNENTSVLPPFSKTKQTKIKMMRIHIFTSGYLLRDYSFYNCTSAARGKGSGRISDRIKNVNSSKSSKTTLDQSQWWLTSKKKSSHYIARNNSRPRRHWLSSKKKSVRKNLSTCGYFDTRCHLVLKRYHFMSPHATVFIFSFFLSSYSLPF